MNIFVSLHKIMVLGTFGFSLCWCCCWRKDDWICHFCGKGERHLCFESGNIPKTDGGLIWLFL